ncbi:MAG: FAD-dependent oxidoreductase, partial [Clostridia bacterium]|nr:FAD-dependent oxidoreductase [Clostridia bacterium]
MKKYDLIVIGGGFSGCAAAIAAARGGLSVLLAEKTNA